MSARKVFDGLGDIGFQRRNRHRPFVGYGAETAAGNKKADYEAETAAGKKLRNASAMAARTGPPDSTTSTMVTDE